QTGAGGIVLTTLPQAETRRGLVHDSAPRWFSSGLRTRGSPSSIEGLGRCRRLGRAGRELGIGVRAGRVGFAQNARRVFAHERLDAHAHRYDADGVRPVRRSAPNALPFRLGWFTTQFGL